MTVKRLLTRLQHGFIISGFLFNFLILYINTASFLRCTTVSKTLILPRNCIKSRYCCQFTLLNYNNISLHRHITDSICSMGTILVTMDTTK